MQKTVGLFFCVIFTIVFTPLPFGNSVIGSSEVNLDENSQNSSAGHVSQIYDIVKLSKVEGVEIAFFSPMGSEAPQDFNNSSMNDRADNDVIQAAVNDQIIKTSTNNKPTINSNSPKVEPGTLFLFGIGIAGLAVMRLRK
jgi:hypothetical protein